MSSQPRRESPLQKKLYMVQSLPDVLYAVACDAFLVHVLLYDRVVTSSLAKPEDAKVVLWSDEMHASLSLSCHSRQLLTMTG